MVRQQHGRDRESKVFYEVPEERVVEHSVKVVLIAETPQPNSEGAAVLRDA